MSQNEFDNEMKKMGVKRLDATPDSKPKTVRISRSSTPPAGAVKRVAPARPQEPDPVVARLEKELEEAQQALQRAEAEVEALTAVVAQAQTLQEEAAAESAQLRKELQEPVSGSVSLKEVFFQRGVLGDDEQGRAFEGLFKKGKWGAMLPMLRVDRPQRVHERLSEDLILHCGQSECRAPKSAVRINVVPERCELCGGGEWNASSVSDALLLNGYRVVILYGGHPQQQNLLRDALDSRIRFRGAPAGQALQTPPVNAGEFRIYWEGTRSDPTTECPEHEACLSISESTLAGLARTVVVELGRR